MPPEQSPSALPYPWSGEEYERAFSISLLPELVLVAASNAIRDKLNWWEKYQDPELDWYVEQRLKPVQSKRSEVPIEIAVDGTRKADGLISPELKKRLLAGVNKLMDVPEHLKDWHPGSDKQVLDLVHPSLFPFIAGRTLVVQDKPAILPLSFIGQGETIPMHRGKAHFESYINSLHPAEHRELYPVLEEILEMFIPMFEEILSDMRVFTTKEKRFKAHPSEWHSQVLHFGDNWDAYLAHVDARIPNPFKVPEFVPPQEPERYNLRGQKLQVVVKLVTIELTPQNPKHTGGSWHVEGMANENIELEHEQVDCSGFRIMFGLEDEQALIQYLDGIVTKEDRCIAFPNIFQHQVQPFELADPTKPGTRKILVFFLVNPEAPVLSTTNVPPLQKAWAPMKDLMLEAALKLPTELVQEIDRLADWPIEMEEALAHRLDLMNERS
ncbi:hypothetical protein BG006_009559 [Podila minutissima]|uniref:DUF4246 domain-containing protein n=1 Tax=Podila minutissima TaxID=64525 RepID=A0A9P5SRF1_9FUNG|nr:hypothetical protein BG006_009559 [Podila minutissima]